jgi:hypothetical protein
MKQREPHEGGAHSAICPDCKGSGRQGTSPCAACGGIGRLYRLATPCDGEAWLSAAMLASALGKDPLDAAVIAAITDSAVIGVFLADEAAAESSTPDESSSATPPEPEDTANPSETDDDSDSD